MDIRQVAKRAGVSTATVSRTINNLSVRPGTARRVRQAIEELKYFPNTHARSLVSGRSRIVGLIVSDITNPFFPELVKGFEDAATQKGYEVLLSNTEYDSSRMAIGVPPDLKSARIRQSAFLKAMQKRGMGDPAWIETGNHRIDGGFQAMSRILERTPLPTAVLCSNDLTALGALRAIRRKGLRVPDDISVVGFDDIALAEFTEPPLTTVRLPREEIAGKAFEALLASLSDPSRTGAEYQISPQLVVRESTARARD